MHDYGDLYRYRFVFYLKQMNIFECISTKAMQIVTFDIYSLIFWTDI